MYDSLLLLSLTVATGVWAYGHYKTKCAEQAVFNAGWNFLNTVGIAAPAMAFAVYMTENDHSRMNVYQEKRKLESELQGLSNKLLKCQMDLLALQRERTRQDSPPMTVRRRVVNDEEDEEKDEYCNIHS